MNNNSRGHGLRVTAALLCALLLSSVFSCAQKTEGEAQNQTASGDSLSEVSEAADITTAAETTLYDKLPQTTYDGRDFRILTRDAAHHTKEVYSAEINGELINDSVYNRNAAVSDRFNVNIVPVLVAEDDETLLTNRIKTSVMAGDDSFDLALAHTVYAGSVALEGVLYNWNDMPYTDFSADWWNSVLAEELDVKGHLYLAVSDMCISAVDYTWVMVFNKKLCEQYSSGDLYGLVNDGKWTIDTFDTVIRTVSGDLNGDGAMGLEDLYGFATHFNSAINNWMFALDQRVTEMDDNGDPVLCCNTEKMASIVEKVYKILYDGDASLYFSDAVVKSYGYQSHDDAVSSFFAADQTLIAALRLYVIEQLRSMETDFGIIPFPKWDESQEGYYTHVDGHAPLMCLPKTLSDPEMTSVIIEALSYESRQQVMPAVYDVVLESKYARDEESAAMLDLILEGRVYTFGYIYDGWKGMQWALTNLMSSKSSDYASYYAKNESAAQKQLDSVIKAFDSVIEEQ